VFLCNQITWSEFQRWNRNEAGGDIAEKMFLEGNGAFKTAKVGDIPFVVTMKTDVVNNGIIYQFAPSNYLGKAGVLQEPTMYVKKDKDILRFSCREKIGVTFANTAAVQKVAFKDVTGVYGGDGRIVLTADATAAGTLVGGKVKDAIDTSEGYTNTQA
jgi:hypothetical protein